MAGFINMGYAVICDNCDRRHNFPQSGSVKELKEDMRTKGLFSKKEKHYCSEDCFKESEGLICICDYPRSGPDAMICDKCGRDCSIKKTK